MFAKKKTHTHKHMYTPIFLIKTTLKYGLWCYFCPVLKIESEKITSFVVKSK